MFRAKNLVFDPNLKFEFLDRKWRCGRVEVVASMETFERGLHVKLPFDKRAKITKEGISNVVASTTTCFTKLQNFANTFPLTF